MRVTSPPAALSIAAALAALALLAHPSSAGASRWQRPVPGEVTRSFDYAPTAPFARGAHRGADLAAAPGAAVRAACDGRVVHAGPVPGGDEAVTLACGSRRVTHLPLHAAVERGVRVRAGQRVGTLAPGHGGLHLGVRAAADPFAYEDPLALLPAAARPRPAPPVATPRRPAVPAARPPRPAPRLVRPTAEPARPAPRLVRPTAEPARPLAPPLAWAGLAFALLGAGGTGAVAHRRRAVTARTPRHATGFSAARRRRAVAATRRRTP